MPYEIALEPNGAYKRFWGFVTAQEIIRATSDMHGSPHFDDLRYSIHDFTGIEGFNVSEKDVEYLAVMSIGARKTNPNILLAIITEDDKIKALVGHFSSPSLASYKTRIFASVTAARTWIRTSIAAGSR